MKRAYYSSEIEKFIKTSDHEVLGSIVANVGFNVEQNQRDSWLEQIDILKSVLKTYSGSVWFEYSIPRMGKRIDVLLIIKHIIFILEFKIGAKEFSASGIDQVVDYALDLKNFHETSHDKLIVPILIASSASNSRVIYEKANIDKLFLTICCNPLQLASVFDYILSTTDGDYINIYEWKKGRYQPTPSIIEAATALYGGHSVDEISRSDAGAINLTDTSAAISSIIEKSKVHSYKSICFVTGVPGAGKTLVGLNIATGHVVSDSDRYRVFLSGNGPLVAILREALTRDKVQREKENGNKIRKSEAFSEVKAFIQNIHHFRDEYLIDKISPPPDHVALFDEAQRAWNIEQTKSFMSRKKNIHNFTQSEPEFLISCLDRHKDWAVIVCLVGGGQEINTGEAGISEWISSLQKSYPDWHIFISPKLTDSEYSAGNVIQSLGSRKNVEYVDKLHLSVSLRSFRAENVSLLVKHILDIEEYGVNTLIPEILHNYPIVITRNLATAKQWLKSKALGSERYGILVSSQAERLKPHAIDVKSPMDPIHWFLDGKDDVRSSYYLEDVATEFHVQGLELDWACVTWDADFRFANRGWEHWSFHGSKWQKINKDSNKQYQKNAYRVLLTRARQGMVIVVPSGDQNDPTRIPSFYDPTYQYLKKLGFPEI